ncbi:twin-arginine translocation signal domain-containing protein [Luteimonas notoginsengisoli]|uniref:Twin-arginine translocation signal domain-containing protein n=1 Tax=Luteimonas notoginsengisoli TaxID=1578200 RepID=A0ABV7UY93_9GAMM
MDRISRRRFVVGLAAAPAAGLAGPWLQASTLHNRHYAQSDTQGNVRQESIATDDGRQENAPSRTDKRPFADQQSPAFRTSTKKTPGRRNNYRQSARNFCCPRRSVPGCTFARLTSPAALRPTKCLQFSTAPSRVPGC